jgi:phytoene desaturase
MHKKVVIVGTGLGGLSTGLRLASRGYDVHFVEKNATAGGRLNQLKSHGFTFDLGPSFFSMPYEFEELVRDCGMDMPFEFVELDPLYTVHFEGSETRFTLYKDIQRLSQQFEGIEPDFERKFRVYLKKCACIYRDTVNVAVKRNFDSLPAYLLALSKVNPVHFPLLVRSFWKQTGAYFVSREARQIVCLIAFFLGRTPFDTNAVFTLLSHIEFAHTGYYNVKGGMYTIVERMVEALKAKGASFHYNTEIVGFASQKNRLEALIDGQQRRWEADVYVINADAAYFRGRIFQRPQFSEARLRKMDWTMGYFTFYVGLDTKLNQIEHHNYFLGRDYESYARRILKEPELLETPYYYVNVLSKHNPGCAPEGGEALFFVCPVPNLLHKTHWNDAPVLMDRIFSDFSRRIQQDLSTHIVFRTACTPEDWQHRFNLYKGAGLGLSHRLNQIGALRPKNYDEQFRNAFYVGASTVPGAGLPMAVIGSKLVVERILRDHPSV